jgi:outer membrane protein, adhesin transport system
MGLQYTLGAGLSLRSQVEVALAKMQGLQADRETARREIKERLESELREYRSAVQRLAQAELVLKASSDLLASYERLFVVGRRSWLELLNAVKEASFAEQSRHDLQAQIAASDYRLQLYMGELPWQQAP